MYGLYWGEKIQNLKPTTLPELEKKLFKMFDTMKFLKIMLKIVNNTMPLRIKSVIKKRDEITQY